MNNSPIRFVQTSFGLLRVYQWTKNLLVFAALVFAQQFDEPSQILRSIAAFSVLCAISSAVYIFNDLIDIEKDRTHPEKRHRPLPSGQVGVPVALAFMLLLAGGSLAGAYALRPAFFLCVLIYVALVTAYTLVLKHLLIVDVLVIAIGFVIRAVSGAIVLDVAFSNWLVVCTLFLALFLGLGKRRRELEHLDDAATSHRAVLGLYTVRYVDALMLVLAATTLLTYTIYTCTPEVIERTGTDKLYLTLPFVIYGVFRYLYIVMENKGGGDPSRTLLKDTALLSTVLLWGAACMVILYTGSH
ncbi:MAG: decaprenyl-phosphate phosphoribosyltransferase [Candidatus Hydrogenedentota bacterium]